MDYSRSAFQVLFVISCLTLFNVDSSDDSNDVNGILDNLELDLEDTVANSYQRNSLRHKEHKKPDFLAHKGLNNVQHNDKWQGVDLNFDQGDTTTHERLSSQDARSLHKRTTKEAKDRFTGLTTNSEDLQSQLTALNRDERNSPRGTQQDILLIHNTLVQEIKEKEKLKNRLDQLERQMKKILDSTKQKNSQNESRACNCSGSRVSEQEFKQLQIQQRRLYLRVGAQDDRHRDLLNLIQAYRSMVITSADVIQKVEGKVTSLESNLRLHQVKVDRLNLDMHWYHVQQDITLNDTKYLRQEMTTISTSVQELYAYNGDCHNVLDKLQKNMNSSNYSLYTIKKEVILLKQAMQHFLQLGITANSKNNVTHSVEGFLNQINPHSSEHVKTKTFITTEESDDQLFYGMLEKQQGQLDGLSINVEQMRDEMMEFYGYLDSVQKELRRVRDISNERDLKEMEMNKLRRDISELKHNVSRVTARIALLGKNEIVAITTADDHTEVTWARTQDVGTIRNAARKSLNISLKDIPTERLEISDTTVSDLKTDMKEQSSTQEEIPTTETIDIEEETERTFKLPFSLGRSYENSLDKGNLFKQQEKNSTKHDKHMNDAVHAVQQEVNLPRSTTFRPTSVPDNEVSTMTEYKFTEPFTTVGPMLVNDVLNPQGGLRVKPSERDVCALPGIMVGSASTVAKFSDSRSGSWMRDPESRDNHIYLTLGHTKVKYVLVYDDTKALANHNMTRRIKLPIKCTGTGHVMYNGSFFCNKHKSSRIIKYDMTNNKVVTNIIKNAGYGNEFSYTSGANTDIDFAVDEIGLWVAYSSTDHHGHIVVGKVNPDTLNIYPKWETKFLKKRAVNTFMVCGRLYVVSYDAKGNLELSYMFDTLKGREVPIRRQSFKSISDYVTSMNYNPKDAKLYVWLRSRDWQGQLAQYSIFFTS